jgi:hypothetical protein
MEEKQYSNENYSAEISVLSSYGFLQQTYKFLVIHLKRNIDFTKRTERKAGRKQNMCRVL